MRRAPLAAALAFGLAGGHALAQTQAVPEYGLKAVLLHKLPQFVYLAERPPGKTSTLCMLGGNPFGGALEKLARQPGEVYAREVRLLAGTHQSAGCDFVFITREEADRLKFILRRLSNRGVVTISDIAGFAEAGGMVELAHDSERNGVSILINRKAAHRQGVEFNAQLLRLATLVEP